MSRRSGRSPVIDLVAFLLFFGWEGPLAVGAGMQRHDAGLVITGLLITAFCWGLFGCTILRECFRR